VKTNSTVGWKGKLSDCLVSCDGSSKKLPYIKEADSPYMKEVG
jgi:Leucine-rich repeat (LRR) protein